MFFKKSKPQPIESKPLTVYNRLWCPVDCLRVGGDSFTIAKFHGYPSFIVGALALENNHPVFEVIFKIDLFLWKPKQYRVYDKTPSVLHEVGNIDFHENNQGIQISCAMLSWLIAQGYLLLGDNREYFGTRGRGKLLAEHLDALVDVIDRGDQSPVLQNLEVKACYYKHHLFEKLGHNISHQKEAIVFKKLTPTTVIFDKKKFAKYLKLIVIAKVLALLCCWLWYQNLF
jgi:hypothetical protein